MVASAGGRVISPARTIAHVWGAIVSSREQVGSACGAVRSTLGTVSLQAAKSSLSSDRFSSTTPTGSLCRPTGRLCSRYDDLDVAPRWLHHVARSSRRTVKSSRRRAKSSRHVAKSSRHFSNFGEYSDGCSRMCCPMAYMRRSLVNASKCAEGGDRSRAIYLLVRCERRNARMPIFLAVDAHVPATFALDDDAVRASPGQRER